MDNKKEVLKYPTKNSYSLKGMEFLRLHDHGQALIIRTKYSDAFKKHNYDFLIDLYLKEEFANFQLTDFMFARAKGFHGPFSTQKLNSSSYVKLNSDDFLSFVIEIVISDRTQTPKISSDIMKRLESFLNIILQEDSQAFFLKQNKIRKTSEKDEFDHEWSHALNEFYEFLIFNPSSNELFILILAYD
tara:strand:- start:10848 stop:11411 length:564 start_codon:yes stop_codon:yes gene_type:complete